MHTKHGIALVQLFYHSEMFPDSDVTKPWLFTWGMRAVIQLASWFILTVLDVKKASSMTDQQSTKAKLEWLKTILRKEALPFPKCMHSEENSMP